MSDDLLQSNQFFRERVARVEEYDKEQKSHNGEAHKKGVADDQTEDDVREILAHKNVFHRP